LAKGILKKLMNFRTFLTFSAQICAGSFLIVGWGCDSWSFLLKLLTAVEGMAGLNPEHSFNWSLAFYLLGSLISIGSLVLYFLAKNLSAIRYGGIFVSYLVLVIFVVTALIL
jgi:hypothetical protein